MAETAPLRLENVERTFVQGPVELRVLRGASLTVEAGEIVALMGPSGAGKSTLLHIAGLLERPDDGEVWLVGAHIAHYAPAGSANHDPTRRRRLLLHKRQIAELSRAVGSEGVTIVPLRLYLKGGRAKLEIAVGRGKKRYDKRAAIAKRDADRQMQRALRRKA